MILFSEAKIFKSGKSLKFIITVPSIKNNWSLLLNLIRPYSFNFSGVSFDKMPILVDKRILNAIESIFLLTSVGSKINS